MKPPAFQARAAHLAVFLWIAMAFVLPFSTALTLLFSYLAVFASLLALDRDTTSRVLKHPISICAIALWGWLTLSVTWSIAPGPELLEGWSKYRKLLFIPLVAATLVRANRDPMSLLKAFALSNSALALIGLLVFFGAESIRPGESFSYFYIGEASNPTVGRNHITQGAFFVFSAAIAVWASLVATSRTGRLLWGVACLLLLGMAIGVLQGRTAYALFIFGALFATVLIFFLGQKKSALSVLALCFILGSTAWYLGPNTQARSKIAWNEIQSYLSKDGSLGSQTIRLTFYAAGIEVAKAHPISGTGVGSYAELFARNQTAPEELRNSRAQPHSEYILQLVQGGVVGGLLWVLLGYLSIKTALGVSDGSTLRIRVLLCLLVSLYFFGALFNSYLWDLAEGHYLSILLGSLLLFSLTKKDYPPA